MFLFNMLSNRVLVWCETVKQQCKSIRKQCATMGYLNTPAFDPTWTGLLETYLEVICRPCGASNYISFEKAIEGYVCENCGAAFYTLLPKYVQCVAQHVRKQMEHPTCSGPICIAEHCYEYFTVKNKRTGEEE